MQNKKKLLKAQENQHTPKINTINLFVSEYNTMMKTLGSQMNLDKKIANADFVIANLISPACNQG